MSTDAYQIKESPLTRRIIGWLLMGMTPIVGLALWLVASIVSSENQELRRVSQMAAQHNLEMLDRLLFERYGDTRILANLPIMRSRDPAKLPAVMDHYVTNYAPYYALILVMDRQGRIEAVNRVDAKGQPIASSPLIGRSVRTEPWFERALQAGPSISIEDVHPDPLLAQVYGETRHA